MSRFVFVLGWLLAVAPATASGDGSTATASATVDDLAWMAGCWGAVDTDGKRTEECWTAPAGGLMLGLHREVTAGRPAWFEFLRIEQGSFENNSVGNNAEEDRAEGVVYQAMPGGQPATAFPLLALDGQRVTFENSQHDFPQRIIYWRQGDTLHARVEGEVGGEARGREWSWRRMPFPDHGVALAGF